MSANAWVNLFKVIALLAGSAMLGPVGIIVGIIILGVYMAFCSGETATSSLMNKVNSHMKDGNVDDALKCLEDALERDMDNPQALYAVGLFCVNVGKIYRSREILSKLEIIDFSLARELSSDIDEYLKK